MNTNGSVLAVVRSVQRTVMSAPTTTIEEAVAEARRRRRAAAEWVADHITPRPIANAGGAA